jgi:two-component system chemotaxis response regulator CheY
MPDYSLGTKESGEKYKAILVDDSMYIKKSLQKILENMGVEVIDTAANGREAVEVTKKHINDVDFMTLDISMPEMDGLEALKKILLIKPDLMVFMVSAMGQKDKVKTSVKEGAKYFIVKPFKAEKVYEVLNTYL